MPKQKIKPTESELEILQVIWNKGPSSVREINDELNKTRETGYTTTLKMLQIMTGKGLVTRTKDGRNHIYSAAVERNAAQQQLLDKLLMGVFGGSAKRLVMEALGSHKTSSEELEEIKNYIDQLKGGNP
ncbi:MAG: BlaI/MecI/CopY family transcriptional regulator [Bacteroidales bacterium]|nr:BlaI/MecI/CopY family transcriptional regulator [Bacteroidales bacterium]